MNSDERHKGLLIGIMIGFFFYIMGDMEGFFWPVMGISAVFGQVYDWCVSYPNYKKSLDKKMKTESLKFEKELEYRRLHNIPAGTNAIECKNGGVYPRLSMDEVYIWKENKYLHLVSTNHNIQNNKKYMIPLSSINYFTINGQVRNEVNVKGNISGGGRSIKGAVIGGAIAGSTGAIIGSRKSTKVDIKTENRTIDERETILVTSIDGNINRMIFSPSGYRILTRLIPEKDKEYLLVTHNTTR